MDGSYFIDHADDRLDGVAYTKIKEILDKKYGEGNEVHRWESHKRVQINTVGELGEAVASGLLKVYSDWEVEDANISLILADNSERYEAHVIVIYRDPDAGGELEAYEESMEEYL